MSAALRGFKYEKSREISLHHLHKLPFQSQHCQTLDRSSANSQKTRYACARRSRSLGCAGRARASGCPAGAGARAGWMSVTWVGCPGRERVHGAQVQIMAHRPKRTFRPRRADSSDSDGAEEPSAGPRVPGEQAAPGPEEERPPPGGGRAEAAGRPFRGRGSRGRGRVWASSRRAAPAALRADGGWDAPGGLGQQGGRPR